MHNDSYYRYEVVLFVCKVGFKFYKIVWFVYYGNHAINKTELFIYKVNYT